MEQHDGLEFAFILDGKGGGRPVGWDEILRWSPSDGVLCLHLNYQSEKVQDWLRNYSGLDDITCDALLEDESRPRAVTMEDSLLLILRAVNMTPGSDPEDMVALRMFVDERRVIAVRHRHVLAMDEIKQHLESGRGPLTSADFINMAAEHITEHIGDAVADIDDDIDVLEYQAAGEIEANFRKKLAESRRQIITLRRYIAPQRDVLGRLFLERLSWLTQEDRYLIRENAEHTARFIEDLEYALARANVTEEELNSRSSEKMQRTLYLLSLVTVIFLPLGLLTGLLGINVGGIPGASHDKAFYAVCGVLIVIAIIEYLIFRRRKLL